MKNFFVLLILTTISTAAVRAEDCKGFLPGSEQFSKVEYKQKSRRGVVRKTVTSAEVLWKPIEMLGLDSCYDAASAELLYKPTSIKEWMAFDGRQRSAGEFTKWTISDIKPCLEYQFKIKVRGPGEDAMFQLPMTLGPASEHEILESNFVPDPPTEVNVNQGTNFASVSWKPSDCAEKYEINYVEVGTRDFHSVSVNNPGTKEINIQNLGPCTRYELTINALLGDEYSEDLTKTFVTKPRLDAASGIEPRIQTTMDSVIVNWEAWNTVSCIDTYQFTICAVETSECRDTDLIVKPRGIPTITYEADGLSPCTEYTVEIQPIFPDTKLEPKILPFRTSSPDAETQSVGPVETKAVTSGTMMISWPHLSCASQYNVYQKQSHEVEWKRVAETNEMAITVDNITPCAKYNFAVTAVLDGKETEKSFGEEIMSDLDEDFAFEAPNLHVDNRDRNAIISWQHAACIESYLVKVCTTTDDCREISVDEDDTEEQVVNVTDLSPCTQYTLEVIPLITGKTFTARINDFTTTNGTPQPPSDFKVDFLDNSVLLSWADVQCNTGFRVYHKTGGLNAAEGSAMTTELSEEYEDPIPCETYYYAVSSLVDEQESERSKWKSITIPPRGDLAPELRILSNENDNMTLRLDTSSLNEKCQVMEYELTYGIQGHGETYSTLTSTAEDKDKDIVLSFRGASGPSAFIMGRVLYAAGDKAVWSAQVSSRSEENTMEHMTDESETGLLVPVLVGALICFVCIIIVIMVVIKRRRSRNNYDAEKAENGGGSKHHNQEERQKLNESHPDA